MENSNESVQDVMSESSSGSPEQDTAVEQSSAPKQTEVPFHEHPRWKEVMNERNEFSNQLRESERRYEDLRRELEGLKPKAPTPDGRLLDRLKGLDPEFGAFMEQQYNSRAALEKELAEHKSWRSQQEINQLNSQIKSSLDKLHTENKVPDQLKKFYESALESAAKQNPRLTLNDLPSIYKNVHNELNSYIESVKRDALASYSQEKKVDAKIPSAPKGLSPKPSQASKPEFSRNKEEALQQIVKRVAGLRSSGS